MTSNYTTFIQNTLTNLLTYGRNADHATRILNKIIDARSALLMLEDIISTADADIHDETFSELENIISVIDELERTNGKGYLYEIEENAQKAVDDDNIDWEDVYGVEGYSFIDMYGDIH